jgi:hypothetical protein
MAEMIATYAGYYSCPRPEDDVVEVAGLTEKRNSAVVKLSGVSGAVFSLAEYLYALGAHPKPHSRRSPWSRESGS